MKFFNFRWENENVLFEQEREKMINKMKSNPKLFEDLNEILVVKELKIILSQMYTAEKRNVGTIIAASKQQHIIDQWTHLMNYVPEIEEGETPNFLRLVKRAVMAPNAQTGCERANSQI